MAAHEVRHCRFKEGVAHTSPRALCETTVAGTELKHASPPENVLDVRATICINLITQKPCYWHRSRRNLTQGILLISKHLLNRIVGKNCVILPCSNMESILLFSAIISNVRKSDGSTAYFQSSRHSK